MESDDDDDDDQDTAITILPINTQQEKQKQINDKIIDKSMANMKIVDDLNNNAAAAASSSRPTSAAAFSTSSRPTSAAAVSRGEAVEKIISIDSDDDDISETERQLRQADRTLQNLHKQLRDIDRSRVKKINLTIYSTNLQPTTKKLSFSVHVRDH